MPKTKASLLVIAATALTVLTLFLLPFTPKVPVRTTVVARGELIKTTLLEGVVSYRDEQPCVAAQAGRVSAVYVAQGQRVSRGDLLFSLDTTAEEEALASLSQMLYEQEKALKGFEGSDAIAAAAVQSTWEARKTQVELLASVESKQIRAASDGVVGGVYAEEGSYVAALSVLGSVRGEGKRITAVNFLNDTAEILTGSPADVRSASGESLGLATLVATGAPAMDEKTAQYVQQLTFEPAEEAQLADAEIGDRVTVEMLCESLDDMALVPLGAVGSGDRLWVISNGTVTPVKIDVSRRNDQYVCVPDKLIGQSVVLLPDEYALYAGCPVKEAKKR